LSAFKGWANGILTNWTPPAPPRVYSEEEKAAFAAERPDLLEWHNKAKALPIAIRANKFRPRAANDYGWRGFNPTAPAKKAETWPTNGEPKPLPDKRKRNKKLNKPKKKPKT
jgi:hypothetical protein